MKVTVNASVIHDGSVHEAGTEIEVSKEVAADLQERGLVEEQKQTIKADDKE